MDRYGKIVNGVIQYAPKFFDSYDGIVLNPSAESYLARGWKKIVDIRPPEPEGYYAKAIGWTEGYTVISRVYEMREIVKPPRRWTPLAIKRAADKKGWWVQLREALVAADLLEEFWGCQYIAEDDPKFPAIKAGMVSLFGEALVDKFLASTPQEVGI